MLPQQNKTINNNKRNMQEQKKRNKYHDEGKKWTVWKDVAYK